MQQDWKRARLDGGQGNDTLLTAYPQKTEGVTEEDDEWVTSSNDAITIHLSKSSYDR